MLCFAFLPQIIQPVLEVSIPFNPHCTFAIISVLLIFTKKRTCFVDVIITQKDLDEFIKQKYNEQFPFDY